MKKGDIVRVYNSTLSGKWLIKDSAKLVKHYPSNDDPDYELWDVQFKDENKTYAKWVKKEKEEG